ncbi:hypothetical protein [Algoriphagus sp. Y33]|uniref:hypothetical protein n=1 Tax=Algoriphagus sp. Y33 TaxID=2772483 RepID=UPI00177DD987|nr:hypothetical protein [Algoriphagus sp. Y33]
MKRFSEGASLRVGMVSFFPLSCSSLLIIENNQPTSYSSAHLEQSQAPSPKGEGWDEVRNPITNWYGYLAGIKNSSQSSRTL